MEPKQILADNIRYYLKKTGKTQAMVAADLGVSRGVISDWTNGRVFPRMHRIELLADYFGINKSDLLEEKSESNSYFLNAEVARMAQELYDDPDARALFSASRKLSKEDVEVVKNLIDRLTK